MFICVSVHVTAGAHRWFRDAQHGEPTLGPLQGPRITELSLQALPKHF